MSVATLRDLALRHGFLIVLVLLLLGFRWARRISQASLT